MIEVRLPNGSIVTFPDGTPPEAIQEALRRDFPKTNSLEATQLPLAVESLQQAPVRETPPDNSGGFKSSYLSGNFTRPSEEDQKLLDETLPNVQPKTGLTPTTVLQDEEAMGNIRKYMINFQGFSADTPNEQMVESFLAHSRKFAAGQSLITMGELFSLQKADEEKLAVAANAYDTFDRFEGVFSEDYTWGETFEGLGSYARAVIVDPANLLGLGVGRLIVGGSTKAGTVALRAIAKEAAEKQMKKTLVKKLGAKTTKTVLEKQAAGQALKIPEQKAAVAIATQAAKLAERDVLRKAATTATVSSALKKQAIKETAIATGVNTAIAVGVDVAYQEGMMLTGRQEEYDNIRLGLAALGGLVGGSIAFATSSSAKALGRESEGIITASQKYNPVEAPTKVAAEKLARGEVFMKDMEKNFTEFSKRVASGRAFTEEGELLRGTNEQEFFKMFLLGNEELGVKGLANSMADLGITLPARPRYEGDNVTSFIADTLQRLPKKQLVEFEELFRKNVGTHIPNYKEASMKDIANLMSYQSSVSGQTLNIFSNIKKILGVAIGEKGEFLDTTVDKILDTLNPAVGLNSPSIPKFKKAAKDIQDKPRTISYFQNLLIQTIVTHPGTTAANISGSVSRGALDTAADFMEGILYTGYGIRGFIRGDKEDLRKGVGIIKAAYRRPLRLVPSRATLREAEDYLALRPEAEKVLFRFRSGGVENADVYKEFNMGNAGKLTQKAAKGLEAYKSFTQKLYLTEVQDRFFKNLNMMYYLDKNISIEFGMSYKDFIKLPDAAKIMQSERYLVRELKAAEETLASVFAKSFSSRDTFSQNPITHVATLIEDIRKIPIVGSYVPFGQFFNNTVDLMASYTGAKLVYNMAGAGAGRSKEAVMDGMAKTATGWTAVWLMSGTEMNYIDEGLSVFDQRDSDGQIVSKQYDFPESFFKGMARLVAYQRMGKEVPAELVQTLTETFSVENLFRSAGQGVQKFKDYFGSAFDKDPMSASKDILEAFGAIGASNWISGFTRPIDPLNKLSGFFKEGGATVLDRRQGFRILNESARYIDQFPFISEGLKALGSEDRNFPSSAAPPNDIGKIVGYRVAPEQSYTQRMMNGIERQYWQSGFSGRGSTGNVKLDNHLNSFIFSHVEPRAAKLLLGSNWKNMSLPQRQKAVDAIWSEAKKAARRNLIDSPEVEDFKLAMVDKAISEAGSQKNLSRAMSELGLQGDITDYDAFQIQAVIQELNRLKREDIVAPYK